MEYYRYLCLVSEIPLHRDILFYMRPHANAPMYFTPPYTPLYKEKLGFTVVYIFLIFALKQIVGTRKNRPSEVPTIYVLSKNNKFLKIMAFTAHGREKSHYTYIAFISIFVIGVARKANMRVRRTQACA